MIIQQPSSFPSVNEVYQSTEPFSKSPIPLLTTTIGFLTPFTVSPRAPYIIFRKTVPFITSNHPRTVVVDGSIDTD